MRKCYLWTLERHLHPWGTHTFLLLYMCPLIDDRGSQLSKKKLLCSIRNMVMNLYEGITNWMIWFVITMFHEHTSFHFLWELKGESFLQLAYLMDYTTFNGVKEHIWTRLSCKYCWSWIYSSSWIVIYGIKAFLFIVLHITIISVHSQSCQPSVLCRAPRLSCLSSSLSMFSVFYAIYCSLSSNLILVVYSKCIEAWPVHEITVASSG